MLSEIRLGDMDLLGLVYGPIETKGGYYKVRQDGATDLETGARLDPNGPEGAYTTFVVVFENEIEAARFVKYCCDKVSDQTDLRLYIRSFNWYHKVWGVILKPVRIYEEPLDYYLYQYEVTCYLHSPYSYSRAPKVWSVGPADLPQTKEINNNDGFYDSGFDTLAVTCHYDSGLLEELALAIGSKTLRLTDKALTNEIWDLHGKENTLLETYEDTITSVTQWSHDTTGNGAYDTGAIKLNNAESGYYILHGPNPIRYPVHMTADLSLDAGGATGKAYVEISSDGLSWDEALDESDFETGSYEYVLGGSEFRIDLHVRFRCDSGTAGKYLRIGAVKFEVERWIESGGVPEVSAGETETATLSCKAGPDSATILGEFTRKRLFL